MSAPARSGSTACRCLPRSGPSRDGARTSPPARRRPASGSGRSADEIGMGLAARPCGSRAPGRLPTAAPPRRGRGRTARRRPRGRGFRGRRRPRPSARAGGRARAAARARLSRRSGERRKIEVRVAPLQGAHGIEDVVFERLHGLGVEGRAAPTCAEGAVADVPPGAAGDLAELGRIELRKRKPSNFLSDAKATWSTSRLRPMPMASVATR